MDRYATLGGNEWKLTACEDEILRYAHCVFKVWLMLCLCLCSALCNHDDVIKWKHFPRYWPFVWGIHRSPVNSPHKGQWRGVLMLYLICAWISGWVNNHEAGDLRRHCTHYDVTVMIVLVLMEIFVTQLYKQQMTIHFFFIAFQRIHIFTYWVKHMWNVKLSHQWLR